MPQYAPATKRIVARMIEQLTPAEETAYRTQRAEALSHADGQLTPDVEGGIELHILDSIMNGGQPLSPHEYQVLVDEHETRGLVRKAKLRAEAERIVKLESAPPATARPQLTPLPVLLSEPDTDPEYRIDGLFPTGGNVMLAAQYKAGKSTLTGNLIRSLADGTPFLGRYKVRQAQRIVLFDNELDRRITRRWLADQGIMHPERVTVVNLRGKLSTFDLVDPAVRQEWADAVGFADVLILDCLRPVLDALGLDENTDAGQFLQAWDEFQNATGATESLVVHHMGHTGERQRGSSRLLDWPDATWKIVREDDDPSSPRFFSAYGRDVDVSEGGLVYNAGNRHLTYSDGGRKTHAVDNRLEDVLTFLEKSPGTSTVGIKRALPGDEKLTKQALDLGVQRGLITGRERQGKGGGMAWQLALKVTASTPAEAPEHPPENPPETLPV